MKPAAVEPEAVEQYLREGIPNLDNPLRQDRTRVLEDLALLFRIYFAIHSRKMARTA